ncbi:MAG: chalcone isomerase family protein [Agarilytica sp.]
MKFAIWDIYKARLYSESTTFDQSKEYALELIYFKKIKKSRLVKETQTQLKGLEFDQHPNYPEWIKNLDDIWQDVTKHDAITLRVKSDKTSEFYFNNTFIGRIDDPDFSLAFSSIWLSPKTSRPKLRNKLLNQTALNTKTINTEKDKK